MGTSGKCLWIEIVKMASGKGHSRIVLCPLRWLTKVTHAIDMNTNEIISYNLSLSPNMEQIKDMLHKAFERFPSVSGLIMHSDQGWQSRTVLITITTEEFKPKQNGCLP